MKYEHILSAFQDSIWAILPAKFAVIKSFLLMKAEGGMVSEEEIALLKQEPREPMFVAFDDEPLAASPSVCSRSRAGAVAVLPLTGTISHRMGMMSEFSGGTSTERFKGWLQAAVNDPNVKAIVIDCDSPGGTVDGVPELADEIYKAREAKSIIGVANASSASAAYYLLSQCSELVVTPSGKVGSIGVFAAHEDISKAAEMQGVRVSLVSAGKYKTEGNPFEPLSDEAKASLQKMVDHYYDSFVKAVARGRGVSANEVRSGFGEGRMVTAQEAVTEKMADRVATLDQTLTRLGARPAKQMSAESETPALAAESATSAVAEEQVVAEELAAQARARELELS
jgi:signal peptide peptidase SppA